ncbi:MAG: glycosyltransferase [Anaerolineae bacterium]
MRAAILHDWLNQLGGAEEVLEVLHGMYPSAPILTSIYDRARMPQAWQSWDIRSSWMDRLPAVHRRHQPYLPLFALAWAMRRTPPDADLVLSNKSGFCIGARTGNTPHVCYCLAPSRYVFDLQAYAANESIPKPAMPVLAALNIGLRRWERAAAQRVTQFVAISTEIQSRIKKYYGRDSVIIYPPVDVDKYWRKAAQPGGVGDGFFLIVSRLLPYKRIDLAIQACNQLGLPLVIAGAGRDEARLRAMAGPTVKLLGRVSDETLAELLNACRGFIFPGLEDFGIAPIHAMACGKPVIAFAGGGSLDTVKDGVTGILFDNLSADSLAAAIRKFSDVTFAPDLIRGHAEQFSVARFERELVKIISETLRKAGN